MFPCRAPEASVASRESVTWGSEVELEAMESEQTGLAFSLSPSPEHMRTNIFNLARGHVTPSPLG